MPLSLSSPSSSPPVASSKRRSSGGIEVETIGEQSRRRGLESRHEAGAQIRESLLLDLVFGVARQPFVSLAQPGLNKHIPVVLILEHGFLLSSPHGRRRDEWRSAPSRR